jgi:hypothetical protein
MNTFCKLPCRDASTVQLLGLAISGCPGTAVTVEGSSELLLQDVVLQQNNHKQQQDYGGALLISNVKQVRRREPVVAFICLQSR